MNPADLPLVKSFIFWGDIGTGKTPLACTAPGPILFLMFDHQGDQSIRHVQHLYRLLEYSKESEDILEEFMRLETKTMKELASVLASGQFKTVVLDSVTAVMDRALVLGVKRSGTGEGVRPTMLNPQRRGYGARSSITKLVVMNLHTLCARYDVNFIVTAHAKDDYNDAGDVRQAITMMLGGESYVQVPKNFPEVWAIEELDGVRYVRIRNQGLYRPCRTRMFRTDTHWRFVWNFDVYNWEGDTLELWLNKWDQNGKRAIPLPKDPPTKTKK